MVRNVIGPRLHLRLAELRWSLDDLLYHLHQIARNPGYESLQRLGITSLSKIRHQRRSVYDYEAFAIAEALGVSVYWLAGLTDDPTPPQAKLLPPDES